MKTLEELKTEYAAELKCYTDDSCGSIEMR